MNDSRRALINATLAGTVLQVAMVLAGHSIPAVAALFAVLGMAFSLVAGVLYAQWVRTDTAARAMTGGAVAGGACALIGIAISFALGDVTAVILAVGTLSSAVTGAIGGSVGRLVAIPGLSTR